MIFLLVVFAWVAEVQNAPSLAAKSGVTYSSNYPEIVSPTAKTIDDLIKMGLVETSKSIVWEPCESGCSQRGFVQEKFFGRKEEGSYYLYVCPNPQRDVILTDNTPPTSFADSNWKCVSFQDLNNG